MGTGLADLGLGQLRAGRGDKGIRTLSHRGGGIDWAMGGIQQQAAIGHAGKFHGVLLKGDAEVAKGTRHADPQAGLLALHVVELAGVLAAVEQLCGHGPLGIFWLITCGYGR